MISVAIRGNSDGWLLYTLDERGHVEESVGLYSTNEAAEEAQRALHEHRAPRLDSSGWPLRDSPEGT